MIAVANEETVHIVTPNLGTQEVNQATKDLLIESKKQYTVEYAAADEKDRHCTWDFKADMVTLTMKYVMKDICWHPKGDYFSTMAHNL